VTWVVGFALIADCYGPDERGRVSGIVMSGTSGAVMVGPTLGGWLYEAGGIRAPFLVVAAFAALAAAGFSWLHVSSARANTERVAMRVVLQSPAVAVCAAVVVAVSATISMLEPVFPLFMTATLGIGPSRVGLVFGSGAVASTILHPIFGRLADRWGGRRMMIAGLVLVACTLPLLRVAWNYPSTIAFFVLNMMAMALVKQFPEYYGYFHTQEFYLGNSPKPRLSVGFGVNWNSPFGPFRIDIAKALLKEPGDNTKLFTFNVGTQF